MAVLFSNVAVAASEASPAVTFGGAQGLAIIRASDFGGGTLVIQAKSLNDETPDRWDILANGSFTTNAQVRMNFLGRFMSFRAQLIGGTGATDVFVEIKE